MLSLVISIMAADTCEASKAPATIPKIAALFIEGLLFFVINE
jgi:hypothetical protein